MTSSEADVEKKSLLPKKKRKVIVGFMMIVFEARGAPEIDFFSPCVFRFSFLLTIHNISTY